MSLAERLFNQIKLQQERETAYAAAAASYTQYTEEREAAKALRNEREEQLEKATTLRQILERQMQANANEIQALAEKHEAERKALMKALEEKVAAVNSRVEATATAKAKAEHDNSRLKEQINIIETHMSSGTDKFTELMNARDKEVGSFSSQIEKEQKISELLAQQNQMTQVQMSKLTVIHDTLKAKVDVYSAKFSNVQDQLKAAKAVFDESQKRREVLARKLNTLQQDREASRLRTTRARKDYELEEAKAAQMEKQIMGTLQQIEKLKELTESTLNLEKAATSSADETATKKE